ncbi:MAG: NAD(P)-dependent oxidoreductase [Proteobacteria bacterium]|nr:NAD(P)-dependent oxidoreductase [Pseudomonadota bacterium]
MGDKLALIGVGKMGRALLTRMLAANHQVKAYDIADEPMATARAMGAATATCSAEAARDAAFVHVLVHDDQEVLDATLGPGGVLEGAGAGATVLLHSTILPETTARVAEAAELMGVDVADAPITSVPRRLEAGGGTFLVGGADDVVAKIRPHLESVGKAVYHFGPLGSGNVAKIAKNLTNAVERVMFAEAVEIVQAAGLDAVQFLDMARDVTTGATIEHWDKVNPGRRRPRRAPARAGHVQQGYPACGAAGRRVWARGAGHPRRRRRRRQVDQNLGRRGGPEVSPQGVAHAARTGEAHARRSVRHGGNAA